MSRNVAVLFVLSTMSTWLGGCGASGDGGAKSSPEASPVTRTDVEPDREEDVKALEQAGAKLTTDKNGHVRVVDFRGTDIDDQALAHLAGLKDVRAIKLNDTAVTDQGLAHLAAAHSLEDLDLRGCAITNVGIAHLAGLHHLKALRLSGQNNKTTVDDGALQYLKGMTALKVLAFDFLWVGGELDQLSELKQLEELYLKSTLIDDASLEQLARFPALRKLRIAKANDISGEGLAHVGRIATLESLDVSENPSQVTDQSVAHLGNLTGLKSLNLWRTGITDQGLSELDELTELEWLNVDNTQVTDQGLTHLAGMKNLRFLHLGSTMVTDGGVPHLEELTGLRELNVSRTSVTKEGVEQLQQKLPDAKIQLLYVPGG